jgi:hypothetical protein
MADLPVRRPPPALEAGDPTLTREPPRALEPPRPPAPTQEPHRAPAPNPPQDLVGSMHATAADARPATSFWRKCVAAVAAALSHPGPQQSSGALLRPLFDESLSIEEMVASVRAEDAGRRADQARRFRMAAVIVLIVVVAAAVAVVVVR